MKLYVYSSEKLSPFHLTKHRIKYQYISHFLKLVPIIEYVAHPFLDTFFVLKSMIHFKNTPKNKGKALMRVATLSIVREIFAVVHVRPEEVLTVIMI